MSWQQPPVDFRSNNHIASNSHQNDRNPAVIIPTNPHGSRYHHHSNPATSNIVQEGHNTSMPTTLHRNNLIGATATAAATAPATATPFGQFQPPSHGVTIPKSMPPPPNSTAINTAAPWNPNQHHSGIPNPQPAANTLFHPPPPLPPQPFTAYPDSRNPPPPPPPPPLPTTAIGTSGGNKWTLPPPPPITVNNSIASPSPPHQYQYSPAHPPHMMPVHNEQSLHAAPQHYGQQPPNNQYLVQQPPNQYPVQQPPNNQYQVQQPPTQYTNSSYPPPPSTSTNNYNSNNNGGNLTQQIPHIPSYLQPADQPAPIYHPHQALLSSLNPSPNTPYTPTPPSTTTSTPPPSNSRYVVQDDGNASPRLLRATSSLFPKDSLVHRNTGLGMGLLCSPLAVASEDYAFAHRDGDNENDDDDDSEDDDGDKDGDADKTVENEVESVPVIYNPTTVNSNTIGGQHGRAVQPIRCSSCQAYINPFTQVTDDGSDNLSSMLPWPLAAGGEFKFRCNFCGSRNRIASTGVKGGGGGGAEADVRRLPLKFGTVEYEVGGAYVTRRPTAAGAGNDDTKATSTNVNAVEDIVVPPPVHLYALDAQDGKKLRAYLDATRCVAKGLGASWERQRKFRRKMRMKGASTTLGGIIDNNHDDGSGVAPRIGVLVYAQDNVIIPHWKNTTPSRNTDVADNTGKEAEEMGEIVVSLMTDIADPFCPLPLDEWTYDVTIKSQRHALDKLLEQIPSIVNQMVGPNLNNIPTTNSTPSPPPPPPPPSSHRATSNTSLKNNHQQKNCGGAALAVLIHAIQSDQRYTAGRCTLLTSSRPNHGAGAIRDRQAGNAMHYGGVGSETKLFTPLQRQQQHHRQGKISTSVDGTMSGDGGIRNPNRTGAIQDDEAALFYRALGERCTQANITCTITVTTPLGHEFGSGVLGRHYLDVATLGELCRHTSGKFKWLKVEDSDVLVGICGDGGRKGADGTYSHQLRQEMRQSAIAYAGSDAVFKVRCSSGVQVKSYLPKTIIPGVVIDESINDSPELEMTCITPDTCIAIDLHHRVGGIKNDSGENGGDNPVVYFQTALLYTNAHGRRRVRVTTLGIRTTTSPGDLLRTADIGAVAAMVTRRAVGELCDESYNKDDMDRRLKLVKTGLSMYCGEVRANHQQHSVGVGSTPTMEFLQMLRLFCDSLCRSRMFRVSSSSSSSPTKPSPLADERAYYLLHGARISPIMAMLCVHPNLYRITDMPEEIGDWVVPQPVNSLMDDRFVNMSHRPYVQLPPSIRPTITSFHNNNESLDGIYMLDDGFTIYIYVSPDTNKDIRCELLTYEYGEFFDDDGYENSTTVSSGLGDGFITPSQTLTLSKSSDFGKKIWRIIRQHRRLSSMSCGGAEMCSRPSVAPVVVVIGKGGLGHRKPLDDDLEDEVLKSLMVAEDTTLSM